jgi:hypothetical protein
MMNQRDGSRFLGPNPLPQLRFRIVPLERARQSGATVPFFEWEQITYPIRYLLRPSSGRSVVVNAMLETADFFEAQIKQCRDSATRSNNKNDREFWLKMANRWEGLLHAR